MRLLYVFIILATFLAQAAYPQTGAEQAVVAQSANAVSTAVNSAITTPQKVEEVNNPYGLTALWNGGDFVARTTLIILVLMSMGSWYVIITKLIDHIKLIKLESEVQDKFWNASTVEAASEKLSKKSPYCFIAQAGIKSADHHEGILLERININTWLETSIQRSVEKVNSQLQSGLSLLATVGSTAPFVGLFGTVWGIYNALTAIGVAGQASIDKVAGPVGEALIMTAIGLAVAVPAVLGYNFLIRRNKSVMDNIRSFGLDLHSILLSGAMTTARK